MEKKKFLDYYKDLPIFEANFMNLTCHKLTKFHWSGGLVDNCTEILNQNIKHSVTIAKDFPEIIKLMIPDIIDCLFLKGQLKRIYSSLKKLIKQIRKQDIFPITNKITFSDFIIVIIKVIKQKQIIGQLMSQVRIPLPIYFQYKKQKENNLQLIQNILNIDNYSIILNIGSNKARNVGKTQFIFQFFSLPQKDYQYGNQSHFSQNSLYVHTVFQQNENKLLIDFNGSIKDFPQQFKPILDNCALMIFHTTEAQIIDSDTDQLNKQFFTQQYSQIVKKPQKLIILVRDCDQIDRDSKQISELIECQNHAIFFLSKPIRSEDNESIVQKICQQNMLKLKKELNFKQLSANSEKNKRIDQYRQNSNKVIELIPKNADQNLTNILFPNLALKHKIMTLSAIIQEDIKQLQYKQSIQKDKYLLKIQKDRQFLKSLSESNKNKIGLSQFVEQGIKIIERGIENPQQTQMLNKLLQNWKSINSKPLMAQYIRLSNLISQLKQNQSDIRSDLKIQLQKVNSKIQVFDISTTTIMSEIIEAFPLPITDNQQIQYYEKNHKFYQRVINKYYQYSYQNMFPINLVDGKTLTLGNQYLKLFCQMLSQKQKFKGKKVYVVSVIGAQSSAKSSLLNKLFRSRFDVSAGRCTKGMYFNICQMEDKVLFVIDTEGLLSAVARDQQFDNKVATFILCISDIVIINNKGQLTSQLKDMLGICMFVMQFIRSQKKQHKYEPIKLMFALRDQQQAKQGSNIQEQSLAKIRQSLDQSKQKISLDYRDFFNIQPFDIYSFPSAISTANVSQKKFGNIKTYNQTFGDCIKGFRAKINILLDNQAIKGRQSISKCYNQLKFCWETVVKCGQNLMNYKTFYQVSVKELIRKKLDELKPGYITSISNSYISFFKNDVESEQIQNLQKTQYLKQKQIQQIRKQKEQQFKQNLKSICVLCKNMEWFQSSNLKILSFCQDYENYYLQKLQNLIIEKIKKRDHEKVKQQMEKCLKQILLTTKNKQQVLNKLKQMRQQIDLNHKRQKQKIQTQKYLKQSQIADKIKQIIKDIIEKPSMKPVHQYEQMFRQHCNLEYFYQFKNQFIFNKLKQNQKHVFFQQIKKYFARIAELVNSTNQLSNWKQTQQIKLYKQKINDILHKAYDETKQSVNKRIKQFNFYSLKVQFKSLDDTYLRSVTKGCLIKNLNKVLTKNLQRILSKQQQQRQKNFQTYKEQIQNAFNEKNDIQNAIQQIFNNIIKQKGKYYNQKAVTQCKDRLQSVKANLNVQDIIDHAFTQSFLSQTDNKKKWIECFKMVVNTNKYLYEIMCTNPLIATINGHISKIYNNITGQCKQFIQTQLRNMISDKSIAIKYSFQFNLYQSKWKTDDMLELMNTQIKTKTYQSKFIDTLNNQIHKDVLQQTIKDYIQSVLRYQVIGCPKTCPLCGIKCKLQKDHSGSHQVKPNCHSLKCFAGLRYVFTSTPVYEQCCSKESFQKTIDFQIQLTFIQNHHPQWLKHFQSFKNTGIYQNPLYQAKYQIIWANICDVFLKAKHPSILNDNKFERHKKDPLTDADINNSTYKILGQERPLKQYLQ